MALSKALGRQKTLNMPNQSKTCLNTIIVTEVELDHCIFHMEFHAILQGFELCHSMPPPTVPKHTKFIIDSVCKSKIIPYKNDIRESQLRFFLMNVPNPAKNGTSTWSLNFKRITR